MSTRVNQQRNWFWWVVIIVCLVISFSLIKSIVNFLSQKDRLTAAQEDVERLKGENKQLESEYRYKTSKYYLEEVVRDTLNMGKKGETVVIIPEEALAEATSAGKMDATVNTQEKQIPVWKRWFEKFF